MSPPWINILQSSENFSIELSEKETYKFIETLEKFDSELLFFWEYENVFIGNPIAVSILGNNNSITKLLCEKIPLENINHDNIVYVCAKMNNIEMAEYYCKQLPNDLLFTRNVMQTRYLKDEITEIKIDTLSFIPKEDCIVVVTKDGYVKRVSKRSYSASDDATGLKELDYVIGMYELNTMDTILMFTDNGNYLYVPVHEIPDMKWKDLGKHISNIIKISAEENIIDNFVRYHPILTNSIPMKEISDVIDLGKTIAMDISSPDVIWENIHSKNRNMIRKAEKNGIEIHHAADMALFKDFVQIYNATMDKDNADEYYYFGEEFYKSIHEDLNGHYEMFYATYEGKIIAMSIMLFANKQMHYHLSGSVLEYRILAPSNLLLYKAALWGCEQGYKTLHLGGGVGSGEDSLYKFKATFNKNSNYRRFYRFGRKNA